MKKNNHCFLIAATLAVFLTFVVCGGGGNGSGSNPGKQRDVYVVGIGTPPEETGTLWKNGVRQVLSLTISGLKTHPCSVFVSGNDVYVFGYETYETSPGAYDYSYVLWKNGIPQRIGNRPWNGGDMTFSERPDSLFVSGNDVYLVGQDNEGFAVLWKNGVKQRLSESPAYASSVFVSGGDVYASGGAVIWKNGVMQVLQMPADMPGYERWVLPSTSLSVSGNDVYVVGTFRVNRSTMVPPAYTDYGLLWKNGVPQFIRNNPNNNPNYGHDLLSESADSVFALGDDVYVVGPGRLFSNQGGTRLWKNGVPQLFGNNPYLPGAPYNGSYSLYVSDNDIYIVGNRVGYSPGGFWVNGVRQDLEGGFGYSSVFVK